MFYIEPEEAEEASSEADVGLSDPLCVSESKRDREK